MTYEPQNRLLSALGAEGDIDDAVVVELKARQPLYEAGGVIKHVYFPLDAVVSIVADLGDGSVVEVATIGREGMVGVGVALRTTTSDHRAFIQVGGRALRLPAHRLLALMKSHDELDRIVHVYVQALMAQIARSAACNRAHAVDERTARWLLMTHDRVGRDQFPLTQEFLGQMLGVARPRVSTAAATLQRAGLIRYSRGRMEVLDRRGLEQASCECYRVITDEYQRLLGDP
ncbi:MAG TPA: Crp/Fnr family transcriptional regulator [Acidimicrobiales bacterium]|nr:Crp/Fnr family transcriptional regulator [Acidimicrobiales bacterium]